MNLQELDADFFDSINISSKRIINWMDLIRTEGNSSKTQFRILENFWSSQVRSKAWLINVLKNYFPDMAGNACVIGGWYGLLPQLLVDNFKLDKVFSVDVDPECEFIGKRLCGEDSRIKFYTLNAKFFTNYKNVSVIANTSTEHMTQEDYNFWLKDVPEDVPIVLQGNNFYNCADHIRCQNTLYEFNEVHSLKRIVYTKSLDCTQFHRYMTIGYKN